MTAIQLPRVNVPDRQESLITSESLVILNMLLHEGKACRTADQLLRLLFFGTWRVSMTGPWSAP